MYGLVNQAIKEMVLTNYGENVWDEIAQEAGVSTIDFVSMQYYEDAVTYGLVGAASKVLQQPPEGILKAFGHHWILFTASSGYGPIMDLFGSDFVTAVNNLNHLHARMGMTMPQLSPPRFSCQKRGENIYHLEYQSKRKGLLPMVEGLLEGMAKRYQTKIQIQRVESQNENVQILEIEILEST